MTNWRSRAACLGTFNPDFFAPKGGQKNSRRAKAICQTCPVTAECLDYAMTFRPYYGVWGNTTLKERQVLRRKEAA